MDGPTGQQSADWLDLGQQYQTWADLNQSTVSSTDITQLDGEYSAATDEWNAGKYDIAIAHMRALISTATSNVRTTAGTNGASTGTATASQTTPDGTPVNPALLDYKPNNPSSGADVGKLMVFSAFLLAALYLTVKVID